MFQYWEREAHQTLGHQLLICSPQHQEKLHSVLKILETNKDQWCVRILGDPVLQLEERPVLGEE